MLVVKLKRSRDAPFERPMLVRSFHASSINLRRLDSAFGAGSVATTSNPRARYSAAQLAPMTPVPTTAMRRIGLLYDISVFLCVVSQAIPLNFPDQISDFGVGDAGEVALGVKEVALVLSIEIGGINRTSEVSHEHPVARHVEGDADSLHQVLDQDLRDRLFIDRGAIDGVAARRIAAVSPIEAAIFEIELEI